MRRMTFIIIITLLAIVARDNPALGGYSQQPSEVSALSSEGYLDTEFSGDSFTADIRDVPLGKVLREISAHHAISFFFPITLEKEKVTVRFSHREVDEGLGKILSSYNRIFIYGEENTGALQSHHTRLKEVRIYPRGDEDRKQGKVEMISVTHPGGFPPGGEDRDKGVKRYVINGDKERQVKSVAELSKDLKSADAEIRLEAVKGLAMVGNDKAISHLFTAVNDGDPKVSKKAEASLSEIGEGLKKENKDDAKNVADEEIPPPPEEGQKTLSVSSSKGGFNLELSNDVSVQGVQFTVKGAKATEIRTTSRTEGFMAKINEKNGTALLVSISGKTIAPGTGPIAEVVCNNGKSAHLSDINIQ